MAMKKESYINIIVFFLNFVFLLPLVVGQEDDNYTTKRSDFPDYFVFGTSSSAFQYEGGVETRGINNWDVYTHKYSERIVDRSNGDIAVDEIHRYKEDISLMKETGFNIYRFSISWTRIFRDGTLKGGINKDGVDYYNRVIDELIANGIQPMVTLFHWEVPQAFEDEYGGFLSSRIVGDFGEFVDFCFQAFGDRVKHWITLNEPNTFAINSYATGTYAPGRCSEWEFHNCLGGNSAIEPYIVGHNLILAHARAVKIYREKYQGIQQGAIGITVLSDWYVPYCKTDNANIEAASRAVDFLSGWFFTPVVHGHYPESMIWRVGDRLPNFNEEERSFIKGSFDFLGVNYYTSNYAVNNEQPVQRPSYLTDSGAISLNVPQLGPKVNASSWLAVYPRGLRDTLLDIKRKYNDPVIYITENGYYEYNNSDVRELIDDTDRVNFYKEHLYYLHQAIEEGVRVKGFLAWTLLDDFEWQAGYTERFGLTYVDFNDNLKITPKLSLKWFNKFLKT